MLFHGKKFHDNAGRRAFYEALPRVSVQSRRADISVGRLLERRDGGVAVAYVAVTWDPQGFKTDWVEEFIPAKDRPIVRSLS